MRQNLSDHHRLFEAGDDLIGTLSPMRIRDLTRFGYTSVLLPALEDGGWLATRKPAEIIGFSGRAMKSQMVPFGGHAV